MTSWKPDVDIQRVRWGYLITLTWSRDWLEMEEQPDSWRLTRRGALRCARRKLRRAEGDPIV